ncbi:MAG: hypothetical protein NXI19_21350 [Alphaproteobacteria bacterium]|jgi:hypothetical protein|nr:hypothetical protein [Alphaproteobacteria bacterium]
MKLLDYPLQTINVSCRKCDRRGRYAKAKLIERYGADIALPDLRLLIANGCSRIKVHQLGTDPCGVMYPDLLDLLDASKDVKGSGDA